MDFFTRLFKSVSLAVSGEGEPEIVGVWARYDDSFAGCQVEVRRENGETRGTIIAVPETMRSFGWREGDPKWLNIEKVSPFEYRFKDTYKALDLKTREAREAPAGDAVLTFRSRLLIEIESGDKTQKWRRLETAPDK